MCTEGEVRSVTMSQKVSTNEDLRETNAKAKIQIFSPCVLRPCLHDSVVSTDKPDKTREREEREGQAKQSENFRTHKNPPTIASHSTSASIVDPQHAHNTGCSVFITCAAASLAFFLCALRGALAQSNRATEWRLASRRIRLPNFHWYRALACLCMSAALEARRLS